VKKQRLVPEARYYSTIRKRRVERAAWQQYEAEEEKKAIKAHEP
jgi:hypothetical protein